MLQKKAPAGVDPGERSNERYSPLLKLPLWIQESLVVARHYGDAHGRLSRFVHMLSSL